MGGSRSQVLGEKGIGKSSQHSHIPVLIFWSTIPCVFRLYIYTVLTWLKVVSYCDLSVLSNVSMSLMGFQKKFGWVGGVSFFFIYLLCVGICITISIYQFVFICERVRQCTCVWVCKRCELTTCVWLHTNEGRTCAK